MRQMTKSVLQLARTALAAGEAALPRYSAPTSRHDFTQAQLFAMLAVRQALKLDYRGLTTLVGEWRELRHVLRLQHAPHYSTLCYAAHRLEKGELFARSSSPSRERRSTAGCSSEA